MGGPGIDADLERVAVRVAALQRDSDRCAGGSGRGCAMTDGRHLAIELDHRIVVGGRDVDRRAAGADRDAGRAVESWCVGERSRTALHLADVLETVRELDRAASRRQIVATLGSSQVAWWGPWGDAFTDDTHISDGSEPVRVGWPWSDDSAPFGTRLVLGARARTAVTALQCDGPAWIRTRDRRIMSPLL